MVSPLTCRACSWMFFGWCTLTHVAQSISGGIDCYDWVFWKTATHSREFLCSFWRGYSSTLLSAEIFQGLLQ